MTSGNDKKTTFLARTNFRGADKVFGVKVKDRRQHMYVVGKTGTGKTALLKNMALQDIHAGRGIGIIDPHGEFVEEVIAQIPPERIKDVVYFNPVDAEHPIGFNVLEVPDTKYKHLVVSDLLGIFTKIWANVWSARMEYILQNCILALLDTPGTTLLGIPRLLVDKDYREKIVAKVQDPVVRSFWVHEYETWRDQFRNEAIVPIQNKVGQFLNTSFIRNIVGQPKSTMNIPELMNSGKILLVNVSKGRIGEDNSQLLGAMIITKIQLAAMERVRIPEEERKDFYLYVDEFQNFATDSFASILSEARKYRLDLIIAHQYVGQLVTDTSTKVKDAVFGNLGTMIVFRVGAEDAEMMEKEFEPEFMPQDLVNLPNHHIYLKLMVDGVTSRPFSAVTLAPLNFAEDPMMKEKILLSSRAIYGRDRAEVEQQIARWSGLVADETGALSLQQDEGKTFETICWNCGKPATVPFKPDGKRPVYCLDCLRKIEAGTLIPLPERMPQLGKNRFGDSLGGLGIEFALPSGGRIETPRSYVNADAIRRSPALQRGVNSVPAKRPLAPLPRQYPVRPPVSGSSAIRSTPVVRSSQGAKPVSLAELKPAKPPENAEAPKQSQSQHPRAVRDHASALMPLKIDLAGLRKTVEEAMKEKAQEKKHPEKIETKPPEHIKVPEMQKAEEAPVPAPQPIFERKETSPVTQSQTKPQVPAGKKNVIKPGETIKF